MAATSDLAGQTQNGPVLPRCYPVRPVFLRPGAA